MNKFHCPIVNIDRLYSLLPESAKSSVGDGKAIQLDVTQFGYFKVLGKGEAPPSPLVVKAKFFSKLAEKKIKEAGGAVVLTAWVEHCFPFSILLLKKAFWFSISVRRWRKTVLDAYF